MCKEFCCTEREVQVCRTKEIRHCGGVSLTQMIEKGGGRGADEVEDREAHTESLILSRDTMRHLTDWFYPDGGWGWTVVVVAVLINLVALGPVLGGAQVLVHLNSHGCW